MTITKTDKIVYGIKIDDDLIIDKINDYLIEKIKEDGILNELDINDALNDRYYSDNENQIHVVSSPMDNEVIIIGKVLMSIHDSESKVNEINVLTEHEKHVIQKEIKKEFGINGVCAYYYFPTYR